VLGSLMISLVQLIVECGTERIFENWSIVRVMTKIWWLIDVSLVHRDASRMCGFNFVFQWRSNAFYFTRVPPSCESCYYIVTYYGMVIMKHNILLFTLLGCYSNCHEG